MPNVAVENIPSELKALRRWVGWQYEARGEGKWAKPPINVHNGKKADTRNPQHLATFDEVIAAYQKQKIIGIGFVFSGEDPYSGVNLNDCYNPDSGVLEPWADKIVKDLASYTEISPSDKGIKIFLRGKLPSEGRRRKGNIEIYSDARYFTLTGSRLIDMTQTIEDRHDELLDLYRRLFQTKKNKRKQPSPVPISPPRPRPGDISVITQAMRAKNGEKFSRLWSGDISDYASASEADLALCGMLAYWLKNNPEDIERVFSQSALGQKEKWVKRQKYREKMISITIQETSILQEMPNKIEEDYTQGSVCLGINDTVSKDTIQEESMLIARELAHTKGNDPDWQTSFDFVRRLRNLSQDHPEQFKEAIKVFCDLTNRKFEEFWIKYLDCWPKVRLAEGEDVLLWAAKMADSYFFPLPTSYSPAYQKLASIAWLLSYTTRPKPFCLPRERLAQILGLKYAMAVSRIINILERDGIIICVDPIYSFGHNGKAKGYQFIG